MFHPVQQVFQSRMSRSLHAAFVFLDQLHHRSTVIEAGFQHGQFSRINRALLQITYPQIPPEGDLSFVIAFFSGKDIQQSCLAGTILGNQSDTLSFRNTE